MNLGSLNSKVKMNPKLSQNVKAPALSSQTTLKRQSFGIGKAKPGKSSQVSSNRSSQNDLLDKVREIDDDEESDHKNRGSSKKNLYSQDDYRRKKKQTANKLS